MVKIYTKQGDKGETSLIGGKRIKKDSLRLEAYGTADELNAFIGAVIAESTFPFLTQIQRDLFVIGGILATEEIDLEKYWGEYDIAKLTTAIENEIDTLSQDISPFNGFILPQGSRLIANIHICRTVCRKLERRIASLLEENAQYIQCLQYVNRLSDYFYILAKYEHKKENISETHWK